MNAVTKLKIAVAFSSCFATVAGNAQYVGSAGGVNASGWFSIFSSFDRPLPIRLLVFTAKPVNNSYVQLDWETATETNNDYFTIERSVDMEVFNAVSGCDKIPGAGTSSVGHSYNTQDLTPLPGLSYYRLKQTDFDGKYTYSSPAPVTFTSAGTLIVSRDASSGNYLLDFKTSTIGEGNYTISITNALGQLVYLDQLNNFSGSYTKEYDLMAKGKNVYLVSITGLQEKTVKRVVVY